MKSTTKITSIEAILEKKLTANMATFRLFLDCLTPTEERVLGWLLIPEADAVEYAEVAKTVGLEEDVISRNCDILSDKLEALLEQRP